MALNPLQLSEAEESPMTSLNFVQLPAEVRFMIYDFMEYETIDNMRIACGSLEPTHFLPQELARYLFHRTIYRVRYPDSYVMTGDHSMRHRSQEESYMRLERHTDLQRAKDVLHIELTLELPQINRVGRLTKIIKKDPVFRAETEVMFPNLRTISIRRYGEYVERQKWSVYRPQWKASSAERKIIKHSKPPDHSAFRFNPELHTMTGLVGCFIEKLYLDARARRAYARNERYEFSRSFRHALEISDGLKHYLENEDKRQQAWDLLGDYFAALLNHGHRVNAILQSHDPVANNNGRQIMQRLLECMMSPSEIIGTVFPVHGWLPNDTGPSNCLIAYELRNGNWRVACKSGRPGSEECPRCGNSATDSPRRVWTPIQMETAHA